ncbi:cytochrome p450 [Hirsutella rhossiliensis]|uniref:Cytochrome p450 domain-containing protein n=1 Tax=Hirsutella rhossiliensis TaxID=111463 RepID=A0A9P8MSA8_9HYPO|nr:cytochrome p450 domain-containing protein [Hirsutella rhossiliensis]KAH0961043.1 cytochrome p450 domain-containing protein [Hirsutella rhossiliensis]
MEFASRLCGFDRFLPGKQFDDTYRWHRRLIHQQLGTKSAVARYHDILEGEVQHFLVRVSREPENLLKLFKTVTSAIILKITYGYSIEQEKDDDLVNLIEQMMINLSFAFVPLAWPVDIVPGLKYLPSSLPGMKFKKTARQWNQVNQEVADVPYLFTQKQMAGQYPRPSYVSRLLQQSRDNGEEKSDEELRQLEDAIKHTAAIMFAGGADTTASNLSSFLLAMACFPEVQRKAQKEIDDVVGTDRLPCFEDRSKMPYIEGVIKEALRWLPVAPIGTPHTASEDTTCGGYDIPKGAQLMPGIWWFTHDPQVHRDPDAFDPERYFSPRNEPDPRSVVFGFGRRICPGQYLADAKLFLIISQLLAVFNICKAVDENGSEIDVKLEATPGLIAHPADFPFRILPRNAQKTNLLQKIQTDHPWEGSDANLLGEIASQKV